MKDLVITSLETITAFDSAGKYLFTLDELQNTSIAQSEDRTDITGKGGRKLSTLKRNRAVTISGSSGIVSAGLLEVQTGEKAKSGSLTVMYTDYITVPSTVDDTATKYTATGAEGSEIVSLYKVDSDGTTTTFTQGSEAGSGIFSYNKNTKKFTFASGAIAANDQLVAIYKCSVTAESISDGKDVNKAKYALYIDAYGEDKCGKTYRVQFYIPKADFSGAFTLDLGDNQTVHNFEAEALAGGCGAGGSFWTYTIFDDAVET